MVARYATFLRAQKRLVKREKHLVQLVDIVVFAHKKILHNYTKKGKYPCFGEHV